MTPQEPIVFAVGNTRPRAGGTLSRIFHSLSYRETFAVAILMIILVVSVISMLGKINQAFLVAVPEHGGTLEEGVFGSPRFVNPIIAATDTDRDISALVYAGLMRKTPSGEIVPDMAEGYTVSEGGLTYTFIIKEGAMFHDKAPLTADDVVFTIDRIKDPLIKSPLEAVWDGVSVSRGDNQRTVIFRLSRGYASFLENTTVGILPKHIWGTLDPAVFSFSDQNIQAIGSGPYRIRHIDETSAGLITRYELKTWNDYVGARPYIRKINLTFYKSEDELVKAYRKGRVDQVSSVSPRMAETLQNEGYTPTTAVLSRVFGLFFNPNQNDIFRNKDIVRALELSIDKHAIVSDVLRGFGTAIKSPVPISLGAQPADPQNMPESLTKAGELLDTAGYKLNPSTGFREKSGTPLTFSISTADVAELRAASERIKTDLAKVGVNVTIKVFDIGMLNQNVIRPRDYEALLFGEVVRNESDLFAFWHSSQRNDPGLNVAVYTSNKVDKILEDLINTSAGSERSAKIAEFETEIERDMPAIFLYSPHFIYMQSGNVHNVTINRITNSAERFLNVNDWYIRTDSIYKFLQPKALQPVTENQAVTQ